jgi:serine phosphatase RsbU (regulator of sigma subunit)/anti-sigma regulatory factor (Ser/Thr protein kinase)
MNGDIEEQTRNQKLTEELLAARNRLNFLYEMARIAVQDDELPLMFKRIAQALMQVLRAEEVFLILDNGEQFHISTASGKSIPRLDRLTPFALQSKPILILRGEEKLLQMMADSFPGMRNLILLPIALEDQSKGLLGLINYPSEDLKAGDRRLLFSAVEQTGILVNSKLARALQEANRRLDHELDIASQIQASFLPITMPETPGLEFAATLKPAYHVGGDFYDVQPVDGGLAIMVGDVAGKGIPAAMLTAMIHATLKSETHYISQANELLRVINHLLYDELDRSDTFITAFLAILNRDPLQLSYASAGHTAALLWRAAGQEVLELGSTGLPLGISPDVELSQSHISLAQGDVLVLYSDGITEAENDQGRVLGTQALIDLLLAAHPASAKQQLQMILKALDLHRGEVPLKDDVVLFLARVEEPQLGPARVTPFVYPAEKSSVRALAIMVRQIAAELQFSTPSLRTDFINELELAVSEIATNIVVHAYQDYPYTGRIQGRITTYPDRVQIDMIDTGNAFKPDQRKLVFSTGDPPTGGYGLVIARRLLDVCQYNARTDGRNHWHLEKTFLSSSRKLKYRGKQVRQ